MEFRRITFTIGVLLCGLAMAMLLPASIDLIDSNLDWQVFAFASGATFFVGSLLSLTAPLDAVSMEVGVREGFLLTTLTWIIISAFSALPFVGLGIGYSDAYFEAMSGLTTTGATVLVQLDHLPRGILLWRSILQGLGGLGIIVTAIVMLPFLRVGGMQLFQTESSERSEKTFPRAAQLISATAGIYGLLIVACAITYAVLGMTSFDAFCHALTTLSTGGFSTHDKSFGFFQSTSLEWVSILFMVLGSLPFVVMIKSLNGGPTVLWKDEQVRGLVILLVTVSLLLAIWLTLTRGTPFLEAILSSTFNVVSVVSTTGYVIEDYTLWGSFAIGMFFLLTFIGGCAGSTSGGMKIYRLQIAKSLVGDHFERLVSPHRVLTLRYNGRRLPADVPFSVIVFLAIYMASIGIFTVLLSVLGLDLVTSLSSAATSLGNVGPGLGDIVGPAGNFSTLPNSAKWVLSMAMLLGRLELFTVLVLSRPEFWQA